MQDPVVVQLDTEKINEWIGKGAEPSVTVRSLIKKHEAAQAENA